MIKSMCMLLAIAVIGSATWVAPVSAQPTSTVPVFVTSGTYTGNLDGLAGGDKKCQTAANAASLGGTWVAWLSCLSCGPGGTAVNAVDRIPDAEYIRARATGTVIANDKADLTDGNLDASILRDENDEKINATVWTGTTGTGIKDDRGDCGGWTSANSGDKGIIGQSDSAINYWTDTFGNPDEPPNTCDQLKHLYCFQVSPSGPSAAPALSWPVLAILTGFLALGGWRAARRN